MDASESEFRSLRWRMGRRFALLIPRVLFSALRGAPKLLTHYYWYRRSPQAGKQWLARDIEKGRRRKSASQSKFKSLDEVMLLMLDVAPWPEVLAVLNDLDPKSRPGNLCCMLLANYVVNLRFEEARQVAWWCEQFVESQLVREVPATIAQALEMRKEKWHAHGGRQLDWGKFWLSVDKTWDAAKLDNGHLTTLRQIRFDIVLLDWSAQNNDKVATGALKRKKINPEPNMFGFTIPDGQMLAAKMSFPAELMTWARNESENIQYDAATGFNSLRKSLPLKITPDKPVIALNWWQKRARPRKGRS